MVHHSEEGPLSSFGATDREVRGAEVGPSTIMPLHSEFGTPTLIIEAHPHPMPGAELQTALEALELRISEANVGAGLLCTPEQIVVLRSRLGKPTLRTDLVTGELFEHARVGAPREGFAFRTQVERWLETLSSSWLELLHPSAAPSMIPDVIGRLIDLELDTMDGLLPVRAP